MTTFQFLKFSKNRGSDCGSDCFSSDPSDPKTDPI